MKDIDFKLPSLNAFVGRELEKYDVEVGILTDRPAAKWKGPVRQKYGGPANQQAGDADKSLKEIFSVFNAAYNLLLGPWKNPDNDDVVKVTRELAKDLSKPGTNKQRFLNAAQAVVRNPILRGDYGENSPQWKKTKGFSRLFINTGRMFDAIRARFTK